MSSIPRFKRIAPATLTVTVGTPTGGIADIQHWQDGNQLAIAEAAATPGITATLAFSGVTSILRLFVMGYYVGTHYVVIEFWNYTDSAWDVFDTIEVGSESQVYDIPVFDDTDYISSGAAQIRLNHPSAGDNTHDLYIDYVALLY